MDVGSIKNIVYKRVRFIIIDNQGGKNGKKGNDRRKVWGDKERTIEEVINKTFPEISQEDRIGLKYFCEELINYLMGREREDFLKKIEEDKGNGYHFRNLLTGSGLLELEVPRTRNGNFRPSLLLEKYKRFSDGFDGFLFSLISAGYSPDQISRALKRLN